ncbi:TPA: hypothetical protein ACGW3W_002307 [Pseudomonas aeruginosa]
MKSPAGTVTITIEGESLDVLRRFCRAKKEWFETDDHALDGDRLRGEVQRLQMELSNWVEGLARKAAPDQFD